MDQLYLGFKAFDLHELLCHFVAREADYYSTQLLDIKLLDTTFIAPQRLPENLVQVACGAALSDWMNGTPGKVIFVSTDKPMFWLYTNSNITDISGLKGCRIAGFPDVAPPALFLRTVLKDAGLTAEQVTIEAVRDDHARFGMLQSGDVSAALVSSALPPAVLEQWGYRPLICLGDYLRVPTTGLALASESLTRNPELLARLVKVFLSSLRLIHSDEQLLAKVLRNAFRIDNDCIEPTCELVRNHFTQNGYTELSRVAESVNRLLNDQQASTQQGALETLYDFSILNTLV